MLASIVVPVACGVIIAVEPVPDVQECRDSLRAALSRIRTLEIEYEETWQASSTPHPLLQKYREWAIEEQRRRIAAASTEEERRNLEEGLARGEPETTRYVRVVDAFPDVRFDIRSVDVYPDGERAESVTRRFISNGQIVHVDESHGLTQIRPSVDPGNLYIQPVAALGRRLAGTVNVSLDMLLDDPATVRVLGRESLDGVDVIGLQVGPPIPRAVRPYEEDDDYFVQIRLAPDLGWLPVRAEWFDRGEGGAVPVTGDDGVERRYFVRRYELADFEPVVDEARDVPMLFPRTVRNSDGAGTYSMQISHVRINPPVAAGEFDAQIPDGHLVSRDGAVPVVEISGGPGLLHDAVSGHANQAREMLGQAERRGKLTTLFWLNIIGLCVVALTLGVFRWRKRNVQN